MFELKKVKDYCAVGDGAHASIKRVSSGIPYLSSKNFKGSGLDLSKVDLISESDYEKHFCKKSKALTKPEAGDVVVGIIGSLGSPYCYRKTDNFGLSSSVAILRPNDELSQKYLYYFMKTGAFQYAVESYKSGSAQGFLSLELIKNLPLIAPPFAIQQKIAAILTTYDDLIEINNRRIQLLEKIAEEIYKEWFVRLRFPRHETVKVVKGVPEGWSMRVSHDVLKVMGGGTPKTGNSTYWGGGVPLFTPKDAPNGFYCLDTEKSLTSSGLKSCNSSLYKGGKTIFITARGTVGKLAIPHKDMAMNQSCYALIPEQYTYFYFLALKNNINTIKGVSQSGVFDNIVTDTFKVLKLMVPKEEVLIKFDEVATPIFENIGNLLETNQNLAQTRDKLLPRLVSGKLSVENLDINFPPSMEDALA